MSDDVDPQEINRLLNEVRATDEDIIRIDAKVIDQQSAINAELVAARRSNEQVKRLRGRPRGPTRSRDEVVAAFRTVKNRYTNRAPTQALVAKELGVQERTLKDYLAEYDLPWPIE